MLINALFWNIFEIISSAIEWIVFKIILDQFNEQKRSKLVINFFIFLNIFTIFLLNKMNVHPGYKLIIGIIIGFVFYFHNYKVIFIEGTITNLAYWMILIIRDIVSMNIILIINPKSTMSQLLDTSIFRIEFIFISNALLLTIIPIVRKIKYNIKLKKKQYIYICIPIISNMLSGVAIFIVSSKSENIDNIQKIVLLVISIVLTISNISFIKLIVAIVKSNSVDAENNIIREKMNMQYQLYLEMQESQIKVRELYHDINNHIESLKRLYSSNDECENYIEGIEKELIAYKPMVSTGNMILDIIINSKKNICYNYNINFEVNINFSKCEFIEVIDICSIFSNVIDNAIEACRKVIEKEAFIKINGTIVNKMFVLKCENSKENEIEFKKNKVVTDKKDKFIHGLGIKSITSSVKKYDGNVYIDFTSDKFLIKVYIPLVQ